MNVGKIDNNTTFMSGVYFSRASNICFDKGGKFIRDMGLTKVSENGYKYIEDISMSKPLKERFTEKEFINKLAKKFDTFIWHKQIPADEKGGNGFLSMVKIWWADPSESKAGSKEIIGASKNSADEALENMFDKISLIPVSDKKIFK